MKTCPTCEGTRHASAGAGCQTCHSTGEVFDDTADDLAVPDASLKLRALCEGLEIQSINKLFALGQVGDFRRLGERMAERIKAIGMVLPKQ